MTNTSNTNNYNMFSPRSFQQVECVLRAYQLEFSSIHFLTRGRGASPLTLEAFEGGLFPLTILPSHMIEVFCFQTRAQKIVGPHFRYVGISLELVSEGIGFLSHGLGISTTGFR